MVFKINSNLIIPKTQYLGLHFLHRNINKHEIFKHYLKILGCLLGLR